MGTTAIAAEASEIEIEGTEQPQLQQPHSAREYTWFTGTRHRLGPLETHPGTQSAT
jgi:hypothetical protein